MMKGALVVEETVAPMAAWHGLQITFKCVVQDVKWQCVIEERK